MNTLATPNADAPFDLQAAIKRSDAASRMSNLKKKEVLPHILSDDIKRTEDERGNFFKGERRQIVLTNEIISRAKRLTGETSGRGVLLSALQCAFDEQYWLAAGYEEPYYSTSADSWGPKVCIRLRRMYKEVNITWELWHVVLTAEQRAMLHDATDIAPTTFDFYWWNNVSDDCPFVRSYGIGLVVKASEVSQIMQTAFGVAYDLREHVPIDTKTGLRVFSEKGMPYRLFHGAYTAIQEWAVAGGKGTPPFTPYELMQVLSELSYALHTNYDYIVID